jgi:F-type H+-transporting ATPase subunit b
MNLIEISCIFFGHGFGINTNILETNIINLAVVVTVVITFVGDALRELLENRKKTILQNICAADTRAKEVEEKMNEAISQLKNAKIKANEICEQGIIAAQREKKICIEQAEEETTRLKQTKKSSINLQQKKAIQQITQQIVLLSLKQVRDQLKLKMKSKTFHPWVNKVKITKYTSIKKYSGNLT